MCCCVFPQLVSKGFYYLEYVHVLSPGTQAHGGGVSIWVFQAQTPRTSDQNSSLSGTLGECPGVCLWLRRDQREQTLPARTPKGPRFFFVLPLCHLVRGMSVNRRSGVDSAPFHPLGVASKWKGLLTGARLSLAQKGQDW